MSLYQTGHVRPHHQVFDGTLAEYDVNSGLKSGDALSLGDLADGVTRYNPP